MDLSQLQQMKRTSIRINYDSNTGECPIGRSKIGGNPDLPKDFNWFYYKGMAYDGIEKNRPLSFMAQINCEEAKQYDIDNLLPDRGMLYFFYELDTMAWGFEPTHKGSARVYYYSGNTADLVRTDFPTDLDDDYKLPELGIKFSSQEELPDFEEFMEWHGGLNYNEWDKYEVAKNEILPQYEEGEINKILGYANLIQGSMLLGCELSTNGISTGMGINVPEDELEQYKKNCLDWRLLFQLDSIEADGYELMWGDCGRIYYYIRSEDLKALNFDNCWLVLQCS